MDVTSTVILEHDSWYRLWEHISKELGGPPAWDETTKFLGCIECTPIATGYDDAKLKAVFRTKEEAMLFRLKWA